MFNANSVDPDQTPRSAASDQGLHCLPMSLLWDARLKWVNQHTNKNELQLLRNLLLELVTVLCFVSFCITLLHIVKLDGCII